MTIPNVPIPVSQVALVVKDMEKSMRDYTETMGWGPWKIYEYKVPRLHDTIVRGAPGGEFTWIGAETPVGSTYVELLQPLEGPSIFREFLDTHGEGLHHIGYWAKTIDEAEQIQKTFAARGVPLLMSAWIDQVYFYYLDSSPMIIEVWTGDVDALQANRIYP
jgi:catechol 2,3-dioxygenase-like lactoylglutathione lyase family enzyme